MARSFRPSCISVVFGGRTVLFFRLLFLSFNETAPVCTYLYDGYRFLCGLGSKQMGYLNYAGGHPLAVPVQGSS